FQLRVLALLPCRPPSPLTKSPPVPVAIVTLTLRFQLPASDQTSVSGLVQPSSVIRSCADRERPLRANLSDRMRTHPSLTPLQDHSIPENIKKVFDTCSRMVARDAPNTRTPPLELSPHKPH